MQQKVEVRIVQFENAANDLAQELGVVVESVTLNVKLNDFGRLRQAEKLHELLQDNLGFRLPNGDVSAYQKGDLVISFDVDAE